MVISIMRSKANIVFKKLTTLQFYFVIAAIFIFYITTSIKRFIISSLITQPR